MNVLILSPTSQRMFLWLFLENLANLSFQSFKIYLRVVTGPKFLNWSGPAGSKFRPVLTGRLKKLPRPVKTGKN
jgi:hypothetical protein